MEESYRTVAHSGTAEFTEKRSRFIGYVLPVTSEEQAAAAVASRKKEYWDARHNVWAYVLRAGAICRYSDDGEPQGTAGVPVLEVLQKGGLTDCVLVVTRYFGGVLLGGGGLVRAYSHTARLAVDAGERCTMRRCVQVRLTCDYAQYGWVSPLVAELGGCVTDTAFADTVTLWAHLPQTDAAVLQTRLTERSAGTLTLQTEDVAFYPVEESAEI